MNHLSCVIAFGFEWQPCATDKEEISNRSKWWPGRSGELPLSQGDRGGMWVHTLFLRDRAPFPGLECEREELTSVLGPLLPIATCILVWALLQLSAVLLSHRWCVLCPSQRWLESERVGGVRVHPGHNRGTAPSEFPEQLSCYLLLFLRGPQALCILLPPLLDTGSLREPHLLYSTDAHCLGFASRVS